MPVQLPDQENNHGGLATDTPLPSAFSNGFYIKYGKRILDLVIASAGLILLSPFLGLLACCIKLTSRGPVLYRQTRIGKNGCPFQILKFRSMLMQLPDSDQITVAGDPRVTAIGRILRHYKIDELPQLWNVVHGDMSLVGPRPELPIYVSEYRADQRIVLSARPGITDPASLVYRHEEALLARQSDPKQFYRTQILPDKLARNIAYLEKISLRNDIYIILKTVSSSFLFSGETQPLPR